MAKLIAILNVVAWSGFWAFGYIAMTGEATQSGQIAIAALLAAIGAFFGLFAYLWLVRHSEHTGYADMPKRAYPNSDDHEGIA